MKIGCLGMATLDTLLFTGQPVYDHEAVTPVDEDVISGGGKGIVCAIAMQRAGALVSSFALVGTNSELAGHLPATLDRQYLLPLLDTDNKTWIMVSAAHKVVTFVARGLVRDRGRALEAVSEFVANVDALYVTIENSAVLRRALQVAAEREIAVALNPSLPFVEAIHHEDPDLLSTAVSQSSLILCNDWEAPRFLRSAGVYSWDQLEAPQLEEVVVTGGAAGGKFSNAPFKDWEEYAATPVREVRCVVGAGDTFNGAYLTARLVHGLSPEDACRQAADLAAIKVAQKSSALGPLDID